MRFFRKRIILLILPVLFFWALPAVYSFVHVPQVEEISQGAGAIEGMYLSERHYIVFPIVVATLLFVFFQNMRFMILGLLCISPIMFFGFRYVFSYSLDTEYTAVVLTRLKDDTNESKTLRLREQVLRFTVREFKDQIDRDFEPLRSYREGAKRFPKASAIVWGNEKTVRVSLRDDEAKQRVYVRHFGRKTVSLYLVNRIPGLSLSFEPIQQTGWFLAHLFESQRLEKENRPIEELEGLYVEMGEHRSSWKRQTHLAYPWWRLGNLYVEEAVETMTPEVLADAANSYTQAAAMLLPYEHPLIRAAIFNNKAVSLLIAEQRITKQQKKSVRQLLKKAEVIAKRKGPWHFSKGPHGKYVMSAIRQNLKSLKVLIKGKKKNDGKQRRSRS